MKPKNQSTNQHQIKQLIQQKTKKSFHFSNTNKHTKSVLPNEKEKQKINPPNNNIFISLLKQFPDFWRLFAGKPIHQTTTDHSLELRNVLIFWRLFAKKSIHQTTIYYSCLLSDVQKMNALINHI